MSDVLLPALLPGQRLARGVCRALRGLDFATLLEFVPAPGLRVDVIGLGPGGEIWVVECKSCRVDFVSDLKWGGYLEWCDRFFWAVDADFPTDLLPPDAGVILADAYDAEIQRWPEASPLPAARRRALTQRFARTAATRLGALGDALDPSAAAGTHARIRG
jgi:hypothetical protein